MVLSADGELWSFQPDEIVSYRADDTQFVPLTAEEAGAAMLKRLPEGFEVYSTAHYVICHNTSRAYAQWCGALYERLYTGFISFWSHKGITLHDMEAAKVSNLDKALHNARQLADEVMRLLPVRVISTAPKKRGWQWGRAA